MAEYFKIGKTPVKFSNLPRDKRDKQTEEERGLTEKCEESTLPNGQHSFLLFPDWCDAVKVGGKQYIMCLNCLQHSHL
jgi:hypothetical protein